MRQLGLAPSVWASRAAWRRVKDIEREYEFVSVLGSGLSAVTILAKDLEQPRDPFVVLKVYNDGVVASNNQEKLKWRGDQTRQAEIETLVALYRASGNQGHPNVMSYIDAFVWVPEATTDGKDPIPTLFQQAASDAMLEGEPAHIFSTNQEYTVLVLDYVPGIDMFDYYAHLWENPEQSAKTLSWTQLRALLRDALAGLAFMHGLGFAHRDIKPENMYIWKSSSSSSDNSNASNENNNGGMLRLMLLDMGFSCHLLFEKDETQHALACKTRPTGGTVSYVSPEFAHAVQPGTSPLSIEQWMSSDIWSLALSFAIIATGEHPSKAVTAQASPHEIIRELLDYKGPPVNVSYVPNDPNVDKLLKRMLSADWRQRPTAVEALQILNSLSPPPSLPQQPFEQ